VIAGARRDDLEVAAKELDVDAIVFDNTDPASLEEARGQFPHQLDTVVNVPSPRWDAGDPRTYSLADLAAAWRNTLDTTAVSAVLTVQILGDHLRSGGSIVTRHPRASPRGQRRSRREGRDFGLDPPGKPCTFRHSGHHRQRGGIRTQRRAGLRRPVPHTPHRSPRKIARLAMLPHHTCRAAHHRPDAARQPRSTGQLRLIFPPGSPRAKRGDRPA